jgi:hypothetical protein
MLSSLGILISRKIIDVLIISNNSNRDCFDMLRRLSAYNLMELEECADGSSQINYPVLNEIWFHHYEQGYGGKNWEKSPNPESDNANA